MNFDHTTAGEQVRGSPGSVSLLGLQVPGLIMWSDQVPMLLPVILTRVHLNKNMLYAAVLVAGPDSRYLAFRAFDNSYSTTFHTMFYYLFS